MDFMSECMVRGRRFRSINLIDDYTREVLGINISESLLFKHILRTLERLILDRYKINIIRTDNRQDFISKVLERWSRFHEIQIQFFQQCRPLHIGFLKVQHNLQSIYISCISVLRT